MGLADIEDAAYIDSKVYVRFVVEEPGFKVLMAAQAQPFPRHVR